MYTWEGGPPSAPAVIYFFKIAVLTIIRLAVFNLLTVSLHISSYLSECLCLCGARLLILQLAPLPGDGLNLPRALLRLGVQYLSKASKHPMATVATITTPCSRNLISEADKCYEDKDNNHAFAGNDHSGTADQVLKMVNTGSLLYSV